MRILPLKIAVVGASLGGLSAANVLRQLGHDCQIFEAFPHGFHDRGGALGSVDLGLLGQIRGKPQLGAPRHIRGHGHFYGDLWAYLYGGLPADSVHFGVDIQEVVAAGSDHPALRVKDQVVAFDVIIGADGGKSAMRTLVTDQHPTYAGYTLWRGLVSTADIGGPPSGRRIINGCAYETLGFACAGPSGTGTMWNCGVYMAMPEAEIEAPTRNRQVGTAMRSVPDWFVPFTHALFGTRNGQFWDACARHGKVSPHPIWEFAADRVTRGRIALLGDAAHLASPRTGAGAYTAMVDAVALGAAFSKCDTIEAALSRYDTDTIARAAALLQKSRNAGKTFVPRSGPIPSPEQVLHQVAPHLAASRAARSGCDR
jgi:2-polyprenyl-6-methoxyphenol hydroxylase-like FAD-dependent oxidoreductase